MHHEELIPTTAALQAVVLLERQHSENSLFLFTPVLSLSLEVTFWRKTDQTSVGNIRLNFTAEARFGLYSGAADRRRALGTS